METINAQMWFGGNAPRPVTITNVERDALDEIESGKFEGVPLEDLVRFACISDRQLTVDGIVYDVEVSKSGEFSSKRRGSSPQ